MITKETIYKRTSSGKVQIWYGELDGAGSFRTTSGQMDGKKTTSEWTRCEAKNVGRSNATTAEEQAEAELEAMYNKRLERDYHRNIDDIDKKRFISPMLAAKWKDRKDKVAPKTLLFFQPKLDGTRAIASYSSHAKHEVVLTSRDGKPFLGAEHICEQLSPLFQRDPDLILDGELYNHAHKDRFEELMSAIKREPKNEEERQRARSVVQYHVYDLPSEPNSSFAARLIALCALFEKEPELQSDMVQLVETQSLVWDDAGREKLEELMSSVLENGYEGGIVRLNAPYEFKRSKNLLKVKEFIDEEFEIVAIEEGKGNWSGCAKRFWIAVPDAPVSPGDYIINRDTNQIEKFDMTQKNYQRASKATPKGSQDYCRNILQNKSEYLNKFGTLQYFRITNDGVPYLPVMKAIRIDDPRNN